MKQLEISVVTDINAIAHTVEYVKSVRKTLFPMLNHEHIPADLQDFESTYIKNPKGIFLQAKLGNQLIGTAGMMEFNYRFPLLDIPDNAVEVTRLFVEPEFRKMGIATNLINRLKLHAIKKGIDYLYLHTHHFLPGATDFWSKQNFTFIEVTIENNVETLHFGYEMH
ncbi:Acetyltransferase (GNAT) family [Candidatus Ornithobacterium hominis]|uniref:GNAT family N-acetyltransferase n=1 Tax=Candidatus Ornithobacterium hominis TaxID=2497989 RepID=UPI0024BC5A02|nr:GNAT family N-acetyltransferase [Candidatus Ornithobacterium hominis]CAI9429754.1 Acetyltransferase (GNAT) family [Candidatus Ornithobacterium hominis]